jgi:hypothetical protein
MYWQALRSSSSIKATALLFTGHWGAPTVNPSAVPPAAAYVAQLYGPDTGVADRRGQARLGEQQGHGVRGGQQQPPQLPQQQQQQQQSQQQWRPGQRPSSDECRFLPPHPEQVRNSNSGSNKPSPVWLQQQCCAELMRHGMGPTAAATVWMECKGQQGAGDVGRCGLLPAAPLQCAGPCCWSTSGAACPAPLPLVLSAAAAEADLHVQSQALSLLLLACGASRGV